MTSSDISPPTVFERIRRRSSSLLGLDNPSLLSADLQDSIDDDSPTILPFHLGYLTPELMEEAKLQLNETEETKQICLSEMRELIENEVDLVSRTDDNFLLQFLRTRKYNVKRAFKLLQNYFEFRKEYKHIYNNVDMDKTKEVILRNFLGFLTSRDRKGQIILYLKFAKWDPQIDTVDDILQALTGILVYAIEDPATQVSGFRIIFDCRGLSWKHVKICTPQNALLLIRSTQFCFPARYKAIHFFSENKLFNLIWSVSYPFLTSKLKKRITHHGKDVKALLEFIHPSVLPMELGGTQPPFDNSSWIDTINSQYLFVEEMLKYGYK